MTNMTIFNYPECSCLRICNVDDAKVIVIDRICKIGSARRRRRKGWRL